MKVKICGVTRREDARTAVRLGADYVGAILSPGFGRSVDAAGAAAYLEPGDGAVLVGVFVDPAPEEAALRGREAGAGVLQLHGHEPPGLLRTLRDEAAWALWKAVRVASSDDVERAVEAFGPVADGLLLDGGRAGRRGGGQGVRFPWEAVEAVRERLGGLALVVAGGLDPDNVARAVRRLAPDVVDVSSGVEASRGVKDPGRVAAFVGNARAAAGSLEG